VTSTIQRAQTDVCWLKLTLIEVAQITQPDDDTPAAGQCPKRLKSLFKYLVVNVKPISAVQVAEADKPILGTTRAAQHRENYCCARGRNAKEECRKAQSETWKHQYVVR
jgi:hypothetical protein